MHFFPFLPKSSIRVGMNSCDVDRLPDDVLRMIFKLVCQEDQATFDDYSMQNERRGRHWDDWQKDHYHYQDMYAEGINDPPPLALISAMGVCERWNCLISRTPSLWTVLQISFGNGPASLEYTRTFLQRSRTLPLRITLLWNDPYNPFNGVPQQLSPSYACDPPTSVDETVAGAYLVLIIIELYAHVHRWREFTLRTTSQTHIHQALLLISRPCVHPARMLEKLHLELVHGQFDEDPVHYGPLIFPGSVSPINDLILFGMSWSWLSPTVFSSHLVNLRIHYRMPMYEDDRDTSTTAKSLSQLLGALVNLQTLALEVDMDPLATDNMSPIELPHLHCLAIKSWTMNCWTADFLHNVHMPNLRILTLDGVDYDFELMEVDFEDILQELIRLTKEDPSNSPLELDELHLVNFTHPTSYANDAWAMGLLPTPRGLADLPLPGLRTLLLFDVSRDVVRRIVLERLLLTGRLEELYYREEKDQEKQDVFIPDDWQHQVEKYYRVGHVESERYCDVVNRRWSYLD
ncbi:uncharacterized protein BJ212DRAFT_801505 [Suillus subaureus]|uniref:F-box domain-containing protein n=1 Tax=Suillus subaureus TaxID=48587 RepID=A0A9P7JH77_9AGAM|nr:uncharacterized protein BJ212DRAFT_801505 [Suillus subaureus]KAG1822419.1 hypothetical protein BJ212DRAFT_801505 [Suillus subaureus]